MAFSVRRMILLLVIGLFNLSGGTRLIASEQHTEDQDQLLKTKAGQGRVNARTPKPRYDHIVFHVIFQAEMLTEGYYAVSGAPISFTYEGAPNPTVLLSLGNLGPRPIRLQSTEGRDWLDHVKFAIYRQEGDPAEINPHDTWSDLLRRMELVTTTMRVKERRIERIQYLKDGVPIIPSEYELDPVSNGYRPPPELYDDYKTIYETVSEFPAILEQGSHAQAICEFAGNGGQQLEAGVYWVRATIDVSRFELYLPPSQSSTLTRTTGPWEIRRVKTLEDRVNYQIIQSLHHMRNNDVLAAEQALRVATAIAPESIRAWLYLGRFYEDHKMYDEAIAAYRRAKALSQQRGLKPSLDREGLPTLKEVDGRLVFEEPAYVPGMIERVKEKQQAARLRGRKR